MAEPIRYTWDRSARQYRGPSGRFLSALTVRDAIDAAAESAKVELSRLAVEFQAGQINASAFSIDAKKLIKSIHLAAGMVAVGGRYQLNPSTLGRIGSQVKFEYGYFDRMMREVANDQQLLDDTFLARVAMYASAGTKTYEVIRRKSDIESGLYDRERRLTHSDESCPECLEYASRGWQPIGELPNVGVSCSCRSNCKCTFVMGNTEGGAAFVLARPVEFAPVPPFHAPVVEFAGKGGGAKGARAGGGNCGTGKGGFKPGNRCGGGGGGAKAGAARIRRNAPGEDASGVDHAAVGAKVAAEGGTYSHGPPKSAADRKHLAEAEAAGGTAVRIVRTPRVWVEHHRTGTSYHAGLETGIARVRAAKNENGKHEVVTRAAGGGYRVDEHRTASGAHKAARKEAVREAADLAKYDKDTRRLVVKGGGKGGRRGEAIADEVPEAARGYAVKVRVLHRGRGSAATFHAPAEEFKGGGGFRPGNIR